VYAYIVGDLLHIGHLNALRQAKELGNYLIVGVVSDAGVEAYKRTPIIPLEERIEIIRHCDYVDAVVVQRTVDPIDNLKKIQPDIVVHGDDWEEDFPGAAYMRSIGKRAVSTEYYQGQSTTEIIAKIQGLGKDDPIQPVAYDKI